MHTGKNTEREQGADHPASHKPEIFCFSIHLLLNLGRSRGLVRLRIGLGSADGWRVELGGNDAPLVPISPKPNSSASDHAPFWVAPSIVTTLRASQTHRLHEQWLVSGFLP